MDTTDQKYYRHVSDVSAAWLGELAYHGRMMGRCGPQIMDQSLCDQVAAFMDKFGIGKSEFGRLMDAIGRDKAFLHRLYEHHLLYDFPLKSPENILDFLFHEFSDLFTKNGLPIIPGELLENAPHWLQQLTRNPNPCTNWNFVNGFDLLAGTVAIYSASKDLRAAFQNEMSVESLGDFARTIGVGALEMAIAMSHANPLLFIGGLMELTAGIRGVFNSGDVIHMQRQQHGLTLEFAIQHQSLESALNALSMEQAISADNLDWALRKSSRMSFE